MKLILPTILKVDMHFHFTENVYYKWLKKTMNCLKLHFKNKDLFVTY